MMTLRFSSTPLLIPLLVATLNACSASEATSNDDQALDAMQSPGPTPPNGDGMDREPATPSVEDPADAPSDAEPVTPSVGDPSAGGQSGGQTSGMGSAPFPCACLDGRGPVVRASVLSNAGGCIELSVLEVFEEGSDIAAGDVIGGVATPLCGSVDLAAPEFGEGDEVLAVYSEGLQASTECAEYRACSLENCGPFPEDPEDQDALAEWDACDGNCVTGTRQACEAHVEEARLGGRVTLAPLVDGKLQYEWAGELRSRSLEDAFAPECTDELYAEFEQHFQEVMADSDSGETPTAAAPPPEPTAAPMCPSR